MFKFKDPELADGNGESSQNAAKLTFHDTSHADPFHTRTLHLDFPRFNGEYPKVWCYRASQFFEYYVIFDQQHFTITTFHTEGRALVWFQELRSSNGLTTWNEFLKALQTRFGTGSYDDPMETLVKLKQTGSIEEFKSRFETLANRVHDLPDHLKLSCFLGGLKDEIRLPVRMFNPSRMIDAYSLAKIQEELIWTSRRTPKPNWNSIPSQGSRYGGSSFSPKMSLPGSTKSFQDSSVGSGSARGGELNKALVPVQKISQAQMEERRRKGLCYSCDAKWSTGHACEGLKLFLIEGIDEEIEDDSSPVMIEEVSRCDANIVAEPEII